MRIVIHGAFALALLALVSTAASADIIDMEGGWSVTDENVTAMVGFESTRTFGDWELLIPHGHLFGSDYVTWHNSLLPDGHSAEMPVNSTDYLVFDHTGQVLDDPLVVTHADGLAFDAVGFDATEWQSSYDTGQTITVTGTLAGGGTVTQTFTTDSTFSTFQTFTLNDNFTNLMSLSFMDSRTNANGGTLAFDNIEVQAIPEPASLALFGLGVGALALRRRRRKLA